MREQTFQICTRCLMDTTVPDIHFDENGICNYCKSADVRLSEEPYTLNLEEKVRKRDALIAQIRERGKNQRYDCVIGVSGGIDSTYTAYLVKKSALRPLAVHLDNGWDTELSVQNIEHICRKLDIDLYTYVIDWDEFKDLQLSFLKASTPDSEIPTDHAIQATLYKMAKRENVEYILAGTNLSSESIMPRDWSYGYGDWKYIREIQRQFGSKKLKTFPHISVGKYFHYIVVKKIKWVHFLNYFDYKREKAKTIIERDLQWRDYGNKHHESVYTKFFQAYILPTKFGIDKRKAHLSSLICSGQITREQALAEMQKELYPAQQLKEDIDYVIRKFGFTRSEFDAIMARPAKRFWDYPSTERSFYFRFLKMIYRRVKVS